MTQTTQQGGYHYTHPNNDAHPFALRGEGEDLQDVKGENLSRGSLQLQGGQVSVHQGQTNAFCPPHQRHLRKIRCFDFNKTADKIYLFTMFEDQIKILKIFILGWMFTKTNRLMRKSLYVGKKMMKVDNM